MLKEINIGYYIYYYLSSLLFSKKVYNNGIINKINMNNKKITPILQLIILLGGMIFAWTTVIKEFINFYASEGTIFKVVDCVYRNPVTTPCFYGAVGFIVIIVWGLSIWRQTEQVKKIKQRLYHTWFLLGGTLFAWSVVTKEWWQIKQAAGVPVVGCSGLMTSIFDSTCLYGAMFYTLALLLGWYLYKIEKK